MDCSENYAYRVIAGMNEELKSKGEGSPENTFLNEPG